MSYLAFILSFSRSGSTLLASILNNNNEINVLNETWIFPTTSVLNWRDLDYNKQRYLLHIYNKSIKTVKNQKKIPENICQKKNITLELFYKKMHLSKSKVLVEKTPANTIHSNFLIKNFKDSKFIFLTRNPLDIASSYKKRWHSNSSSDDFVFRVALVIKSYFSQIRQNLEDNNLKIIKYEKLVDFPELTVKKICKIMGVEFDKRMLKKTKRFDFNDESKKFHANLFHPIDKKNISNYEIDLSKTEISQLTFLLRDIIRFFDYPIKAHAPTKNLKEIENKIDTIIGNRKGVLKTLQKNIKYKLYYFNFIVKIKWKKLLKS